MREELCFDPTCSDLGTRPIFFIQTYLFQCVFESNERMGGRTVQYLDGFNKRIVVYLFDSSYWQLFINKKLLYIEKTITFII